jgi:beta-lactamase class A
VIAGVERQYKGAGLEVRGGDIVTKASFEQVGLRVLAASTAIEAGKYPLYQRFIPFSSVVHMFGRNEPVHMRIDKERVHYFAEQFEQQSVRLAVNATIAVSGDKVSLVPAKPSITYTASDTYKAILHAPLSAKMTVKPRATTKAAPVSDAEAMETLETARRILNDPLQLKIGEATVVVEKITLASWFDFQVKDGKLELQVKEDAIKDYVAKVQPTGYQAPTATRITLIDGRETGRVVGIAGRGVDVNAATQQIAGHIRSHKGGLITLPTVALTPGTTYNRQYSDTAAGLEAFLKDTVARRGNYAITVIELGGKGRNANAYGDKVYVAASMYKLFLAYGAFTLQANGEMDWSETVGGLRADECLEAMIVHSDNECAWAFGERIGWGRVEGMMRSIGLAHTTVQANSKLTTANDLALFLRKLEDGSLLPQSSRDLLISYLKRQVYRNGIPDAVRLPVANKVGGYGSYVHDAGIVYAPGGTYIMAVMSSGSGWNGLTATAREVHAFVVK